MKSRAFYPLLFLLLIFSYACVTVQFDKQEVSRSNKYTLTPPANFVESSQSQFVDKYWVNPKSGSSISLYSECKPKYEPTLEKLQKDVLLTINDKKKLSQEFSSFNGRKALKSKYLAQVDGVPTHVDILSLSKNHCFYVFTYTALPQFYNIDLGAYTRFLGGLKIK